MLQLALHVAWQLAWHVNLRVARLHVYVSHVSQIALLVVLHLLRCSMLVASYASLKPHPELVY